MRGHRERRRAIQEHLAEQRAKAEAAELLWPFGVPIRLSHEDQERWDRVAAALVDRVRPVDTVDRPDL